MMPSLASIITPDLLLLHDAYPVTGGLLIGPSGRQAKMYVILYNLAPVRRIDTQLKRLFRRALAIRRAAARIRLLSRPREVKVKAVYVKGASREPRQLRGNATR